MRTWLALGLGAAVAMAATAFAQHHGHGPQAGPYAGLQQRPVKALSPEAMDDLRAGRGMGFALAAELNGYPGPKHVLELAEPLRLTPEQSARTEALMQAMFAEAKAKGAEVIEREAALDRLFATRTATPEALAASLPELGRAQGELRAIHLKYHLSMLDVLSPAQVADYNRLRGYDAAALGKPGHGGPGHSGPHKH